MKDQKMNINSSARYSLLKSIILLSNLWKRSNGRDLA
jgi:hypothetical protein